MFPAATPPGRIDAVTAIMGSALAQQSMMRTSPKPFPGSFEMNAIIVQYQQGLPGLDALTQHATPRGDAEQPRRVG